MWLPYEAILFQADFDLLSKLKGLLAEFWNAAVLDGGGSKNHTWSDLVR